MHELLAKGANVNSTESPGTGFQPSKKRLESVPGGTKRPLVTLSFEEKSLRAQTKWKDLE